MRLLFERRAMLTELPTKQDASSFEPLLAEEQRLPFESIAPLALPINERSLLGLVELLLKAPAQLDDQVRDPIRQAELIPRLLILALTSFALFSIVLTLLLLASEPGAVPFILENWGRMAGPAVALGLAYPIGMLAATGICLPTFYFFGLLAG